MNGGILNQFKVARLTRVIASFSLICSSLTLVAKDSNKAHASTAIKIVSMMSFNSAPAMDMQIQEVKGKRYLFVQLANAQGITVVDISRPNKLRIVSSMPSSDVNGIGRFGVNGQVAVTTSEPDEGPPPRTSEVVFWDISHPANPRVAVRFTDVERVLLDD